MCCRKSGNSIQEFIKLKTKTKISNIISTVYQK